MKKADARLGGPAAGAASSAAGTDSASRLSALFLQRVVLVRDDLRANSCGGDVFVCLQTLKAWQLLDGCLRLLKVEDALDGEPSTLRAAGEDRVKAERLGGDGEGRAEERDAVPAPPAAAVVTVRCWEEFARGARPGRSLRREEMLVSPDVWEALSFPENLRQVSVRLWLERLREAPRPCVEAELRLLRICPPQRQNQNQDRNSAAAAPSPPPSWLAAVVERSAKNAQSSAKSRATRKDAPRNRAELLADSFIRFLRLALRNRCFVEKQPLQTRIGGLCCLLEPSVVDPAPSEEAIDRGGPQRAVCTAGDALSSASSSPGVEAKSPEPSSPSEQQVRVWRVSSDCRFRVSLSMKASTSFPPTHRKLAEPTDSPRGFARCIRWGLVELERSGVQVLRLAGCEGALEEVVWQVLLPLLRPDLFRRFGVRQPRGALLTGPPGTGKTFLMKAVAEELELLGEDRRFESALGEASPPESGLESTTARLSAFLRSVVRSANVGEEKRQTAGEDRAESLSGGSPRRACSRLLFVAPQVRLVQATALLEGGEGELDARLFGLFEECAKLREENLREALAAAESRETGKEAQREESRQTVVGGGVLLFIDEIDCLCPKREAADRRGRCGVGTLLACLDGLATREGVFVVGATNHPHQIDEAVRRAGRLETEISVGVPASPERLSLLRKMLSGAVHNLTEEEMRRVSEACQGFVPADVAFLVQTAASLALKEHLTERHARDAACAEEEKRRDFPNGEGQDDEASLCLSLRHLLAATGVVRPSGLKSVVVHVPRVHWTDIGGYEEAKQKLRECVEWPLRFGEYFSRLAMQPPRGVLLYGPPGCSKTMLAKAVATESRMNFVSIKGPELFSKWVGETERAVRQLFGLETFFALAKRARPSQGPCVWKGEKGVCVLRLSKARQYAPCVIFFDEIDALGVDREKTDGSGVESRVLSQLLTEMDGVGLYSPIVVMAATNRPDLLDAALLRPGRFDRLVYVPLPDAEARQQIASRFFEKCPFSSSLEEAARADGLAQKLRSEEASRTKSAASKEHAACLVGWWLAARTEGFSGAEVVMVCREAGLEAIRETISSQQGNLQTPPPSVPSLSSVEDELKVELKHLEAALSRVSPRTPASLLRFYEEYHSQTNRSAGAFS